VTKFEEKVQVLSNVALGPTSYRLEISASKCSKVIEPGQFVHMAVAPPETAMLRRPFSVYDSDPSQSKMTIMYEVIGKGTKLMTRWKEGDTTSILAPLGNTWAEKFNPTNVLLVGGGFGGAPLYMLAKKFIAAGINTSAVLGAKTKDLLFLEEDFSNLNLSELVVTTDDGSRGLHAFCTVPAAEMIVSGAFDYVATCGPKSVMEAIAKKSIECNVACEVSAESFMACGVGACKTCIVETDEGKVRSCKCGPIFDARCMRW
jgi:dihydroorotate dehydrogenase electron transfer subunit